MQITISGTEHAAMKPVNYRNHNPTLKKVLHVKVINAYLYLGKLYYAMYRFDEATENIEEHIQWLEKKKA